MSDHIKQAIKELDLLAEDLEKLGASGDVIAPLDNLSEHLASYYRMEYPRMDYSPVVPHIEEDDEDMDMPDSSCSDKPSMEDMPGTGYNSMPSMEEDYDDDDDDFLVDVDDLDDDDDLDEDVVDESMSLDDDLYGDDEVEEYDSDLAYAETIASVAKTLEEDGALELAAEVQSLLDL